MEKLIFPDLYCPFPSQVNQYVDVLEDYAFEWVQQFNLLKNTSEYQLFSKAKFFLLAAYTYPYCQIEELKIANDWMSWLFVLDDKCDSSDLGKQPELLKTLHSRFLEIFNGSEINKHDIPLSHALNNLRQRMLQIGNARCFNYFAISLKKYFDGCVLESINRASTQVPDFDNYQMIHLLSSAVDISIDISEFCNHHLVSDFVRNHESIKKLKMMTNKIICLCNDIFSAPKEMASGDVHNSIIVLHFQHKIPLNQAVAIVANMHNQELQSFLDLQASIPYFNEEINHEVTKYLSGLHTWIRGNFDWSCNSGRYQTGTMQNQIPAQVA
ncbi:terpene synthase family protein [Nostoc cycadae]|uniref:Terpene synthase n=1 Tax=Nostoc cycadae WK-1 TaxID=1861711 RepID=A0A2H6LIV1_9NOSO|nr:terpene synthase [Nostoc cycadae]GBE93123.1 terpene synthase [Nostoc cycadae WK-1]